MVTIVVLLRDDVLTSVTISVLLRESWFGPGAFFNASIVLDMALWTSVKPSFCKVTSSNLALPSKELGWGWNMTHLFWILTDLCKCCLYTVEFKHSMFATLWYTLPIPAIMWRKPIPYKRPPKKRSSRATNARQSPYVLLVVLNLTLFTCPSSTGQRPHVERKWDEVAAEE